MSWDLSLTMNQSSGSDEDFTHDKPLYSCAVSIVLCKSVVSEGKELISNWPIRFQETCGFLYLICQFDINSFPSLTTDLESTILHNGLSVVKSSSLPELHCRIHCVGFIVSAIHCNDTG